MASGAIDYDKLAPTYDRRFDGKDAPGISQAILTICKEFIPKSVLEVGCGTGKWLSEIHLNQGEIGIKPHCYGLDLSAGMLARARCRNTKLLLTRGRAERLPFSPSNFDLVYCVNALHHFDQPRDFILEARRLLRSGGALAMIGMDPSPERCQWYLYHYFKGLHESDLERYPPWEKVLDWMIATGFDQVEWQHVERYKHVFVGEAVFEDPFLKKASTSQLAMLSDEAYDQGLCSMIEAIEAADQKGEMVKFQVDIPMDMVVGRAE